MRLFEGTEFDIPPKCDRCGELESDCQCPPLPEPKPERISPSKQILRVQAEKRKKGKWVTVVRDLDELDHSEVLTQLKNHLGAGGTIKDSTIEIQGDHSERIKKWLVDAGFRLKK